ELADVDGWLMVKPTADSCVVKLLGTGSGTYHLVWGAVDDQDNWHYVEDEVKTGQLVSMNISSINGEIITGNGFNLWKLIRREVVSFSDAKLMTLAQKEKVSGTIDRLFEVRVKTKETVKTKRIMDYLVLLQADNFNRAKRIEVELWLKMLEWQKAVYELRRSDNYWALNNLDVEDFLNRVESNLKNGNYKMAMSYEYFASRLLSGR
nr:hypothetical protein [Candidatus Shapirobacteria bacterium]